MFKPTGRHADWPRESRGRVRRAVKVAAAALGIAATLAAGLASGTPSTPWLPAQATGAMHAAAQLRPAVTMPQRPVWDGHGVWPNDGTEPLCPAIDAGHVATVGTGAHAFRVICTRDGSQFAWSVTS